MGAERTGDPFDRAALFHQRALGIQVVHVLRLRRIYTARIALDNGKDKLWLMELWGMRSDYPARLLMEAARKTTSEWCSQSLLMCQRLDQRMKSEKGIDSEGELKLLLMRLAQGK